MAETAQDTTFVVNEKQIVVNEKDGATSITVDSKGEIHSDKGKNYHIDLGVIPLSFISKQYYNNNSLSGNCVTIAVTAFGENLED